MALFFTNSTVLRSTQSFEPIITDMAASAAEVFDVVMIRIICMQRLSSPSLKSPSFARQVLVRSTKCEELRLFWLKKKSVFEVNDVLAHAFF